MFRVNTSLSAAFSILCLLSFRFIDEGEVSAAQAASSNLLENTEMVCDSEVYEYFYTSSDRYRQYCDTLYNRVFTSSNQPNKKVFNYALKGYASLSQKDLLGKKNILAFIDYSLSANKKRLWVIDLKQGRLLYHELVAHGRNTGAEYARKFSNKTNSYQSSLGFFVTGEIYSGKHDLSIKMNGMERSFNGKAFDRGIVIHGADYVNEDYIKQNNRLGRSLGCPAVSEEVIQGLSQVISDGACLFAYYPNSTYLKSSKLIKSDVVFTSALGKF